MSNQQLTAKQIADAQRVARHTAFRTSLMHLPPGKRTKIENSYANQDARRERNVNNFFQKLTGA